MKSSLFATVLGIASASSSLRSDQIDQMSMYMSANPAQTTTTYTASSSVLGADGLQSFLPSVSVGGNAALNGVSDLAATSLGTSIGIATGIGAASGAGGAGNLSNIGTGAVLLTSTTTGQSAVLSGKQILDGKFPKADMGVITTSSSGQVNNNMVASGLINTVIANSNINPSVNLNNVFTKLPSSTQIDNLILNADSVGLLKTVQVVGVDTNIPCDQRISFLLELNGRLKTAIEKKVYNADQLNVVINSATAQAERLQNLINQNNQDIQKLGLPDLNQRLNGLLKEMQTAYANFNVAQSQIPVLQAQVAGNQKEIDIIIKNSDKQRNKIANDRLKLNEVITQLGNLQNRLKELQDQQAAVQANITKGDTNIGKNNQAITELRSKIDGLQNQLRSLNDNSDTLNSQVRDLEVKVSRIRTDISVSTAKRLKILKDNETLADRLAIQKRKNITPDLDKLNSMISALRALIPTLEKEVDRHFYYCFGDGKVQFQKINDISVYIVRGDAFGNYLRNLYGRNVVLPAVNGDVLLNRVDIFGANWVGAFGYPFLGASLGGNQFSFAGSFGCTNPTAIVTGSGVISALGSNWIQFSDANGRMQQVNLGSCSRLESTRKIPSIGQKIYWSGVPAAQGFNAYSASCFD